MMRSVWQDLRFALRQLRKSPSFGLTAVTVLALGLGANIAVFTLLNGIILRPLPYPHSDRIVTISLPSTMPFYVEIAYADMLQLRDAAGSTVQMGAVFDAPNASIVGPGGRQQVQRVGVDSGLFPMLGVNPIVGRAFRPEENERGRDREVLLSEQVWRTLFNSDPQIPGKTLTIRGEAYTILGVMPRGFSFPFGDGKQIWTPAAISPAARTAMSGDNQMAGEMFARMPAGMTEAQLSDMLSRAQAQIAKEVHAGDLPASVKAENYQHTLNRDARKPLMLLYGVVVGIWALACLNVTSLLLARAVSRMREQAVRSALGASRARLLQQSIVESLLLSGIGAIAGLLLGQSAIKVLWSQLERHLPLTSTIHLDWRVVLWLIVLTLVTAVIVGVIPALRAAARDVQANLHGTTSTASASQNRTREGLVVGQLALTLVFLVGAGLFLRTLHALRGVPLGFSEQNVLTGGVILNANGTLSNGEAGQQGNVVRDSYAPLLEKLRAIPGVRDAALSSVLPLRNEFAVSLRGELDGKKVPNEQAPEADGRLATSGLVEALGIPMVRGRFFNEDDTATSPVVVVINEAFAKKYLPGEDPIGHTFGMGKGRFALARIVGVIGDMKQTDVTMSTKPEVYFCLTQMEPGSPLYGIATAFVEVAISARIPADALRARFDKALHEVAPDATTTDVKTIHEVVEDSFGSQRLIAGLLETFAGLALMVASVGLYGLLSFAVAQRTREIGLRIALGAPQRNILSLVLRRAMVLVGIGLALGTAISWFASTLARSYIFGVQVHDGFTFAVVLAVLAAASLMAAWLPARRAATVDPILALRSE